MYQIVTDDILELMDEDISSIQTFKPTSDIISYLKNSFNLTSALSQSYVDIPREILFVNDIKIKCLNDLIQLYKTDNFYDLLVMCSNQALISYPYILLQSKLINTPYIITDVSFSKMIISLYTHKKGITVRVVKKLCVFDKKYNGSEPEECFRFKLIFTFDTADKYGYIECKKIKHTKLKVNPNFQKILFQWENYTP